MGTQTTGVGLGSLIGIKPERGKELAAVRFSLWKKSVLLLAAFALVGSTIWTLMPSASAQDVVKLRFQTWRLADPVSAELYRQWISEWNEQNPGIQVVEDGVPHAQRIETFLSQSLAGDPPDIVGLSSQDVVQFAAQGLVRNLDDYYDREGPEFAGQFFPVALKLSEYDGSLYAITHELATQDAMLYNIDLVREHGIDPEAAVQSWDAFLAASEKLASAGIYGFPLRGKDVNGAMASMWPWLMQGGAMLVTEEDIRDNLTDPSVVDALEWYTSLYTDHRITPNPIDIDFQAQVQFFAHGRAAFLQQGSWFRSMIPDANPAMRERFLPLPLPVRDGGNQVVTVDGMSMMIAADSPHPDEAWEFMKYMVRRDHQLQNLRTVGYMPSLEELLEHPDVTGDPFYRAYLELIADPGAVPRLRTPHANEIWEVLHVEFQNVLLGRATPAEALRQASQRINKDILSR